MENCRRRENNLKFKISAQWNRCSLLKEELSKMKKQRGDLESQIKLERDKIKRNDEIKSRMDIVLANYEKSRNLTQAAVQLPAGLLGPGDGAALAAAQGVLHFFSLSSISA